MNRSYMEYVMDISKLPPDKKAKIVEGYWLHEGYLPVGYHCRCFRFFGESSVGKTEVFICGPRSRKSVMEGFAITSIHTERYIQDIEPPADVERLIEKTFSLMGWGVPRERIGKNK